MAVFIPSVKPEDFNNSYGEMKVYDSLRTLNDQYTVFYSLSWVGVNGKRTVGEADFVVLHPQKGILVIEVKSGEIEYKNGEWIQTNTLSRKSKRISPFTQARKSQFELLERLELAIRDFRLPMLCYCAWFPSVDIEEKSELPPESPREIAFDKVNLDNAEKAIDDAFHYWSTKYRTVKLDQTQFRRVVSTICPHFHVVPKLKTKIEEMEDAYIQLTKQQTALLDFIEEQKTAVVHGLAGTGKTVIALEKAKRIAAQDESVLFLCFNSFLKDTLKNNAIPNVTFHNVHSLAYEIMGPSDTTIDKVLSEFEEYLEVVFDEESWEYKNIIVDEGQDLDDRLLNRLYELVKKKNGCFYVFYDRNQYILSNKVSQWIEDAECRLILHKNCRNTAEVFKTSCSIMGLENVFYNEIHGEIPEAKFYMTEDELEKIVNDFVKRVTDKEGLLPDDVVILTAKNIENSWIDSNKVYGGQQLSTRNEAGKILFTTIRKFKGLEANAILIIDTSMSAIIDPDERRILYVGCSRAKNLLNIAMIEDVSADEMGNYLRNIATDRNVPKNKKGLKRLLNIQ